MLPRKHPDCFKALALETPYKKKILCHINDVFLSSSFFIINFFIVIRAMIHKEWICPLWHCHCHGSNPQNKQTCPLFPLASLPRVLQKAWPVTCLYCTSVKALACHWHYQPLTTACHSLTSPAVNHASLAPEPTLFAKVSRVWGGKGQKVIGSFSHHEF